MPKSPHYYSITELPAILTVEDVMKFMRWSKGTAYQVVKREDFPAIPCGASGGCIRIPRDGFEKWLEREMNK